MEITTGPAVEIELAGAVITIPSATIADMWLARLMRINGEAAEVLASPTPHCPPRIGGAWYDGVYAGVARGEDGIADHHLIVMGESDGRLKWQAALDWARSIGCELPTRRELALCFAN